MKQIYRQFSPLAFALICFGVSASAMPAENATDQWGGKNGRSLRHSAPRSNSLAEITDTEILREASGENKSYVRNSNGFFYIFGDVHNTIYEGKSQSIVIDGADAYVYNPVSTLPTDSYIKGKVTEDGIVFSFPQCVYTQEYWDSDIEDYVEEFIWLHPVELDVTDDGASWYFVKPSTPSTYTLPLLDDGTYKMEFPWRTDIYDTVYEEYYEMPEMVLGMIDKDWNWMAYGDFYNEFIPFNEEVVSAPENLNTEKWAFMYNGEGRYINLAYDDQNVWLQGICTDLPEAWIVGERKDDTVVFNSLQFLGVDDYDMIRYFRAANEEMVYDEDFGQDVKKIVEKESLVFAFDYERKTMTTQGAMLVTGYGDDPYIYETYNMPSINLQSSDISPIPANPRPVDYSPYDYSWMLGWVWFEVPVVNINGELLGSDNMAWRWFINGEPYTFLTWDYWGLPETTDWISCAYSDDWDFQKFSGTEWFVYTYSPDIVTLEVQSRYTDAEGNEYFSDRVECANMTSIPNTCNAEVVETGLYDLSGRKLTKPCKGLYLETTKLSDGSIRTVKHMGK